jgi:hypothetical protein
LQTLNRPENDLGFDIINILNRKPRRNYPAWPLLAIIAVTIIAIKILSRFLGSPGVLITTGVGGAALTVYIAIRMLHGLTVLNPKSKKLIVAAWLAIALSFNVSFVISGIGYSVSGRVGADLARIDLHRTVFAAELFCIWSIGMIIVQFLKRSKALFLILWTAATIETTRLLIMNEHPTFVGYLLWMATGLIAGMAIVRLPRRLHEHESLIMTTRTTTRFPKSGKPAITLIDDESRSLAMRDSDPLS